jgi:hypothetical protein
MLSELQNAMQLLITTAYRFPGSREDGSTAAVVESGKKMPQG